MDVVKINDTEELGVVIIPESTKNFDADHYSLNYILITKPKDNSRYVALEDSRFVKIGEIDDD